MLETRIFFVVFVVRVKPPLFNTVFPAEPVVGADPLPCIVRAVTLVHPLDIFTATGDDHVTEHEGKFITTSPVLLDASVTQEDTSSVEQEAAKPVKPDQEQAAKAF